MSSAEWRPHRLIRLVPVLIAAAYAGAAAPAHAQAVNTPGRLAVIVHPSMQEDDLTLESLRHVFLGEQQFWQDRSRITLLMHPSGAPERAAVLRTVYRMSDAEFKRYWIAKLFRAEVSAGPKIAQGNETIVRLVATIPGAVGVVPVAAVSPGVKVLSINGHLPTAAGYPLRAAGKD